MPIVGFNFDKISGEKTSSLKKGMSVQSDINIASVEEATLSLNKPCLKISFKFTVDYTPDIGKLELDGHLLYLDTPEKIKEYTKSWNDSKKLPEQLSIQILNTILSKCNIESLILSEKINLPPQLPIGKMAPTKKEQPSVAQ